MLTRWNSKRMIKERWRTFWRWRRLAAACKGHAGRPTLTSLRLSSSDVIRFRFLQIIEKLISTPSEAELPVGSSSVLVENPKALQRTHNVLMWAKETRLFFEKIKLDTSYGRVAVPIRKTDGGSEPTKMSWERENTTHL